MSKAVEHHMAIIYEALTGKIRTTCQPYAER